MLHIWVLPPQYDELYTKSHGKKNRETLQLYQTDIIFYKKLDRSNTQLGLFAANNRIRFFKCHNLQQTCQRSYYRLCIVSIIYVTTNMIIVSPIMPQIPRESRIIEYCNNLYQTHNDQIILTYDHKWLKIR